MKLKLNLTIVTGLVFVAIVSFSNNVYSQGNSQGNANPNNNANTNAFKWETDGNNADSTDFIGTTNDSPLIIRTNNEERMRITEDGKLGISVLNPLERLELDGNFKLSGDVIFPSYASTNDTLGRIITVDEDGRTQPKTHHELIDIIYQPIECPVFGYKPTWANDVGKIYTAHLSGPNCQANVGIGTS